MKLASRLLLAAVLGAAFVPAPTVAGPFDPPVIPTAPLARPQLAQQGADVRLGAVLSRLGELEEEVRRLRGRIEELEHEQRQSGSRIDRLVGDVDRRLSAIEDQEETDEPLAALPPGRGGSSAGGSGSGSAAIPPGERQPATGTGSATRRPGSTSGSGAGAFDVETGSRRGTETDAAARRNGVEPDPAARRGNVLGTIPRDAVMGLDQPSRQPDAPPSSRAGTGSRTAALPESSRERIDPAREQYENAIGLLQNGNWASAQEAFESFLKEYPNDAQAANAAYWLGETFYVRQDWANAAAAFAKNYRAYGPEAPKAADNLLKLGMSLGKLGDKQRACQAFGELQRRHVTASAAIRQAVARERAAYNCG